jgi:Trk K+ transport system NAD-binding subunit
MKNHVIICGLGNVGFHVFELLHRANIQVAIISDKAHAEWIWQIEQLGGLFFQGDARDDNLLLNAGIKDAKAILALTNQDRINLSIAIDAQKLNPNIKIISRIYDTDLGKLVTEPFDIQQTFSTSELAAPLFANSIVDKKNLGQFNFNGHRFLTYETKEATQHPDDILIATTNNNFLIAKKSNKTRKKPSLFWKFFSQYYTWRTPVFLFLRRFLLILFFIILVSTLFLSWAMPLNLTDALYFVIATVSSVGYGDINFSKSSDTLKYFGCVLMLTGTAIFAILFSSITEMILARKIPNIVGGRPIPRKNHVILVGNDHLSVRIIHLLTEDRTPVVVIENNLNNPHLGDIARQVALVNGNPKNEDTLHRANTKSAKAIFAVTKDDIENLSITIAAKKANPLITETTQVNNTQIVGSLQRALSLTNVLSVPFITGPYFIAAIFKPKIIFAIEWHNQIVYLFDDNGTLKSDLVMLSELNHSLGNPL